ncbi:MAG: hypothetical protein R3E10_16380 [Gemmatimonadota bacterium]
MSRGRDPVLDAIARWRANGLITEELAETLHNDAAGEAQERNRALLQYVLGATAGVVLLMAAGVFIARNWVLLEVPLRCTILGVTGLLLVAGARMLERRERMEPVGVGLRASGLSLLLVAYLYSDEAWSAGSPGALAVAALALLTPWLSLRLSIGRRPGPAAVNTIAAYAFLAVFLDRLGVATDAIVWVLDGVLLLTLAALATRLRAGLGGAAADRALVSFVVSLFGGLILIWWTAVGPLDTDAAIWGLDLWLLLIVAVLLWGIHRAPAALQRSWYPTLLAFTVLIAIVFSFMTLDELHLHGREMAIGPGVIAALGIPYGLRHSKGVVLSSCLAVLAAALALADFGRRSPLASVFILAATAALLFWIATRLARRTP